MDKSNKAQVLKKCALFRNLNDEQLDVIEEMYTSEVFEPGTIICKQDKKGEKVYVVEDGLVGIILEVGPLSQRQVQSASKYDVFGWSAVIEPFRYTATVKAIKKTTALSFQGKDLHDLCIKHPEIGCLVSKGLTSVVVRRLNEAYTQLLGVTRA
jgi:CRP/FNR family cyclic AMP-dependent transcriptional regulator